MSDEVSLPALLSRRARSLLLGVALSAVLSAPVVDSPASATTEKDSGLRVVRSVQISADEPLARHVESALAVNPRDPHNLIAASMVFGPRSGVAVYSTLNGGRDWVRATHGERRDPVFAGIDPAVTFDADGNAYLLGVSEVLEVWKSTDGGRAWSGPSVAPGASWDRPWIDSDRSEQETRGRLFVTGKLPIVVFGHPARDVIGFSSSNDRGATFSFPRLLLPAPEREALNIVSALKSLPDGKLVLALQIFETAGLSAPVLAGSYPTIVSSDGGRRFSEPRPGPGFRTYGHAREGKSLFGLGGARLAVDESPGARKGTLYMAWLDLVDDYYRVKLAASSDGGATWSKPIQVSRDPSTTDQSNLALAVNGEGVVGISWNDRRADPTDRCYQLYFAASADGGSTFSTELRIEEPATCPIGPASEAGADPVTSEYRFKNGGDTQGLMGLLDGSFHLAWIHAGGGELQLYSSVVAVDRDRLAQVVSAETGAR